MTDARAPRPAPPTGALPEHRPIADYGLIADCTTAALVSIAGSMDWLCLPNFDSPAVFARLLDPRAGHWSIAPTGAATVTRRHLPGSLVIETTFTTESGAVRLTDALAFVPGQRGHDLGKDAPHEVLRLVEGVQGEVELRCELAPRPEYGLVRPLFRMEGDGGRTFGGPNRIAVRAGVPVAVEDATMTAMFGVAEGEVVGFSLRWAAPDDAAPEATAPADVAARVADVVEGWCSWEAEHDIYEGANRDLVRFSARVLKGLTYRPTGAIVAAPTAGLPETEGGERNWDYRYAWVRDASLAVQALYIGSCSDEADEFVSFMTSSAGGRVDSKLQIMYGIDGRHDLSEREPAIDAWALERDRIREEILRSGWSERRGAYTQAFESDELDAAALLMPLVGFLRATDPRMHATIDRIAEELTEDGLVLRYRNTGGLNADGLRGEEGTFVVCSFWLVSCLAQAGEIDRAQALFDRLTAAANDLGLLAEEVDTRTGEQLGNFPQAFSHVGLIVAASHLDQGRA